MNEDVEILIVEDSSTQAEDLKHILLKNNYNVTIACNGRAALEIVPKKHPSLIISDIVMPEMNGYELCKTLKSEESTKSIPIILLTSLSDPIDVVNGLKCKADNFITKPYTEEFLISRIHHILINLEMRKNKISELNIDVYFAGEMHTFNSERIQIIDLLLSTFENAIQKTQELQESNNELKKAIATIKKLEKNYRNILESNLDALIVIDKENLISYVNPSAEELLHKERKELLGMPLPFDTKNDYKELKIGEDTIVEMRISDIIWEMKKLLYFL